MQLQGKKFWAFNVLCALVLASHLKFISAEAQVIAPVPVIPPMVVNYRVETSEKDHLFEYYTELIRRALEVTEKEFGPYQLTPLFEMNFPRAILSAQNNSIPNLLMETSYSKEFAKEFAYIPFPIDFGVMSYRVCFASQLKLNELRAVTELAQLKKYSIGQGKGWLDNGVLRDNGFKVIEFANYNSLFGSAARGRFDLFCRSIVEILPEWRAHKAIDGLAIEDSFTLYYVFPRFFWTNKDNKLLIARMTKGLSKIYEDGSAFTLWKKYNQESIDFSRLDQRRIFTLENNQLEGVDKSFEKYFYKPSKH